MGLEIEILFFFSLCISDTCASKWPTATGHEIFCAGEKTLIISFIEIAWARGGIISKDANFWGFRGEF